MKRTMNFSAPELRAEKESEAPVISGYFAVFNSETELYPGVTEEIAPEAFERSLKDGADVRALINHDTSQVLGRTKSNTLTLKTDSHGLYGEIKVNTEDGDAMNLYSRIQRGDVDQCSFGFDIIQEDTEKRENGNFHYTIRDLILYEVSCCTFPAYPQTAIEAREKQIEGSKKRELDQWKAEQKERMKNGTQTNPAE